MDEEAIKDDKAQDVSNDNQIDQETGSLDVTEEKPVVRLSRREQKMQDIIAKRQEQLDNNDGEPAVDREFQAVNTGEHEAVDQELETEHEKAEPKKEETKSPFYLNDKNELVTKLKINGEEVERTYDQIKATAQKNESADIRLQKASERERALKDYESKLVREEQRILALQKTPQPSSQDAGSEDSSEALKEAIESIYDGETESAVEKLKNIMQGRQEPTLDMSELASMAKEEALTVLREEARQKEYADSLAKGTSWINENHSDIMENPTMRSIVDQQTVVIMRENPSLSPEEVIKQATEKVLSITNKKADSQEESSRASAKSQLQSHPKRQSGKRYSPPKEPVIDNSPAAVIAREKQRRGMVAKRRSA